MRPALYLTLVLLSSVYLIEVISRVLNLRSNRSAVIPSRVSPSDKGTVDQSRESDQARLNEYRYLRINTFLVLIQLTLNYLATMIFLLSQPWAWLDSLVSKSDNSILLYPKLYLALSLGLTLLNLPFMLIKTFKIERDFGFSNYSLKLFISDIIKSKVIEMVIALPLLTLFIYLFKRYDTNSIIFIAFLTSVITLVFFKYSVRLFLTKFNKLTPLPEGTLRDSLEELTKRVDLPGSVISTMDASKRSSKANAFFAGVGKSRYIVLFDTLLNILSNEEVVAVMAHEISHYKNKHTLKAFIMLQAGNIVAFTFFYLFLKYNLATYFIRSANPSLLTEIILIYFITSPFIFLSNVISNFVSRRFEHQADRDATIFAKGSDLINALSKLNKQALSNSSPAKLFVTLYYTHPPLKDRAKHIGL